MDVSLASEYNRMRCKSGGGLLLPEGTPHANHAPGRTERIDRQLKAIPTLPPRVWIGPGAAGKPQPDAPLPRILPCALRRTDRLSHAFKEPEISENVAMALEAASKLDWRQQRKRQCAACECDSRHPRSRP